MHNRLRSLRTLTAAFLLCFVIITVGTALVIYSTTLATIDRLVKNRLFDVSEDIVPSGSNPPTSRVVARAKAMIGTREHGDIGFILTQKGKTVFSNVRISRTPAWGFQPLDVSHRVAGLTRGWALTRDLGEMRTMILIAETEPFDNYHNVRIRIYVIGFGSIAAMVIAATLVFGITISRRIREMRHTVDAIIDGNFARRVPTDGSSSEFDGQAVAFNRMLDRIEELMAEVRNVSNGIAHELRTPLARLRNQLELLRSDPAAKEIAHGLDVALGEADMLLSMFAALLRVAEVESGRRHGDFVDVDLAVLAENVVAALQLVAEDRGQGIVCHPAPPAAIKGDPQLLNQMILTLIENAITHTREGTRISVSLGSHSGQVELRIADNGPGIAEADRTKALARFGRLHRNDAPGHGLGLPLAASIAKLHGGTLSLGDAGPGLLIIIRLPQQGTE